MDVSLKGFTAVAAGLGVTADLPVNCDEGDGVSALASRSVSKGVGLGVIGCGDELTIGETSPCRGACSSAGKRSSACFASSLPASAAFRYHSRALRSEERRV